ncbi:MAG: hypothetical protein ACYC1Q_04025, partial [Bacteroidia bacterium]
IYAKFHATIGKIAALNGYKPLILTSRGNYLVFPYYKWFGINEIVDWSGFEEQNTDNEEIGRVIHAIRPQKFSLENLISLEYENVQVGKHTLSMVCRTRLEGQLDFEDPEVQKVLAEFLYKAIRSVLAMKKFLAQYQVAKMLVRDSGYIPNGGIFETALTHHVDCVVHEFGQEIGTWVFKRHDLQNRNEHYFSLSAKTWEKLKELPWTNRMQETLDAEINERYKPNSLSDTRRLQHGKKFYTPEAVMDKLGLDPNKKTAVLFSHVPWDATFFYGSCIFGDYERWLFETVKYLVDHGQNMNWIIKLHPYNAFKLQREDKDEESELRLLRSLFPLPANIVIMKADTDINTQSLFPIIDYVLTVNGTVGMEFPCFGIPSVVAGTGRYDGRGFTYDNASVEAYFELLSHLHELPKLTEQQTELARKHYYHLMCRRQTNLEDIIPMELKKFHEAQSELHNNVNFKPRSLKEFTDTASYQLLSQWFFNSTEYDVLNPIQEQKEQ